MGKQKYNIDVLRDYYAEHGCTLISTEYKTMFDKYTFICPCGNEHTNTFESFKKHKKKCKECSSKEIAERRKMKDSDVIKTLEDKGLTYVSHKYDYKNDSSRKYTLVTYTCKNGHLSEDVYLHTVSGGKYCCMKCMPKISSDLELRSIEEVKSIVDSFGMELLSDSYVGHAKPIHARCVCGNEYYPSLASIMQGNRCGCQRGGENHYMYDHNLTDEERQDKRMYPEYRQWVKDVFERDNYTCQKCITVGGCLHAHHIYGYAKYKDKRTDINNGVTLCEDCHKEFHSTYGLREFQPEDTISFLGNKSEVNFKG
ncbi:HNH endonuclease III [Bacillus phage Phrodo]|uniref:HNH endonuclease III n=1 Tax=Bacillus phage Phrodo TaxID=1805953 RepID=UPI0007A772CF|nr:HNH endonuclease III [Bacillus phage Phrodo]AMW62147.1 HNH endonuclease III [Bacillus phage Phrodo]